MIMYNWFLILYERENLQPQVDMLLQRQGLAELAIVLLPPHSSLALSLNS